MDQRIRVLERNLCRIAEHLGLEFETACWSCGKSTATNTRGHTCAWCGQDVCDACRPKGGKDANWPDASYESITGTYSACSRRCVRCMEFWEKRRPLHEWKDVSITEKQRINEEYDQKIYESAAAVLASIGAIKNDQD